MYKRIMVAIDGSETGQKALDEAIHLARQSQAQLRIIHVIDTFLMNRDSTFFDTELVLKEMHQSGQQALEQACATAQQGDVSAETRLVELDKSISSIADMITSEAESWPADLLVIGSHGRRGVQRLLLGSVAEGVARSATMPVLLVRGE